MAKMAMQGVLLLSIVAALLSGAATAASIRDGRLPPSALDKFTQSKGHWNRGMGPREVKNGWIDTRNTGNSSDWPAVDDHEMDITHIKGNIIRVKRIVVGIIGLKMVN